MAHTDYKIACALIDTACSQFKLTDSQSKVLKDAHEIAFRSDESGVKYVTMSGEPLLDPKDYSNVVDPSGFLRVMHRDRPELLTASPVAPKPATNTATKPATLTEAFIAAKRGDRSLLDRFEAQSMSKPKSAANKPNFTDLFVKAKAGDQAALDALKNLTKF